MTERDSNGHEGERFSDIIWDFEDELEDEGGEALVPTGPTPWEAALELMRQERLEDDRDR